MGIDTTSSHLLGHEYRSKCLDFWFVIQGQNSETLSQNLKTIDKAPNVTIYFNSLQKLINSLNEFGYTMTCIITFSEEINSGKKEKKK